MSPKGVFLLLFLGGLVIAELQAASVLSAVDKGMCSSKNARNDLEEF